MLSQQSGVAKTRCIRECVSPSCYKEIYLFDQVRYIRNTNSVNCIRPMLLCATYIYTYSSIYYFARGIVMCDKHVSVGGGWDWREIKFLQGLLHAAKRSTAEIKRMKKYASTFPSTYMWGEEKFRTRWSSNERLTNEYRCSV